MEIEEIIDNIYTIPGESKELLRRHIREVNFPKGHTLIKAGKIASNIYFLRKGIVRAYAPHEGGEITFWFGKEGDTVVSMKSFVANEEGYENIELLENCELYELKAESIHALFLTDIHIANWGRKFAEHELMKTEQRMISRELGTAVERYKELLRYSPDLVQRVQLSHIASYLGITQVSLSRIRAEISR